MRRSGRLRRNDGRRVERLFGKSKPQTPAIDAALGRAAHQYCGGIAPDGLGIGVAKIPPGEPDVGEHPVIKARERGGVAAILDELEDIARTSDRETRNGVDQPRDVRGGLGIGVNRHGILHFAQKRAQSVSESGPTSRGAAQKALICPNAVDMPFRY